MSIASFLGISIGKITLSKSLLQVIQLIDSENIEILPILPQHVLKVEDLPFHHRDPFDRIIIAQAQTENFEIMSNDMGFANFRLNWRDSKSM